MHTNCNYTGYVHTYVANSVVPINRIAIGNSRLLYTYVANYHIIYTRGKTTFLSSSGKLGSSEMRHKTESIVATTENHSGVTEGVSTSYVYIQLQV